MKAKWIIKTLSAAAMTLALGGTSYAIDYPDFHVDETSVPGCTAVLGCATDLNSAGSFGGAAGIDRIFGGYSETLTPNTVNQTFTATAVFNMTSFFQNDVNVPSFLNGGGTQGYGMYALFTATGSYSQTGSGCPTFTSPCTTNFFPSGGTIAVYVNPDQSSDRTGSGDDYLVASSNTISAGSGNSTAGAGVGTANGNFEIVWQPVVLTPNPTTCPAPNAAGNTCNGNAFFTAPRPFYIVVDANGNFTEDPLFLASQGRQVSGSANAFFMKVPEPNTLLLLGVAVLGAGLSMRRRKTN